MIFNSELIDVFTNDSQRRVQQKRIGNNIDSGHDKFKALIEEKGKKLNDL